MKDKDVYSVSEITKYFKNMVHSDYLLSNVSVEGEVSNLTYHKSGHIYFTLKDKDAALSGAMWSSRRGGLTFPMKNGDKVVVRGSFDVYEPRGSYSIIATKIEKAGIGDLYQKYLALKKELEERGMFDEMYKQPIPKYAKKIGVVTAPTGAAIYDIIRNAKLQNPYVEIILYPALVQGEGASASIVKGIKAIDALNPDVMIVGRGGGSLEDLWAFNEEEVAMAIFEAKTPVISAVGHETDTTIADYVADLRVATPTEAAKKACFSLQDLYDDFLQIQTSFERKMDYRLNHYEMRLAHLSERYRDYSPKRKLANLRLQLNSAYESFDRYMTQKLTSLRHEISVKATTLDERSPAKRLAGGYAYVTTSGGKRLAKAGDVVPGEHLYLYLTQGQIEAEVTKIRENGYGKKETKH